MWLLECQILLTEAAAAFRKTLVLSCVAMGCRLRRFFRWIESRGVLPDMVARSACICNDENEVVESLSYEAHKSNDAGNVWYHEPVVLGCVVVL